MRVGTVLESLVGRNIGTLVTENTSNVDDESARGKVMRAMYVSCEVWTVARNSW